MDDIKMSLITSKVMIINDDSLLEDEDNECEHYGFRIILKETEEDYCVIYCNKEKAIKCAAVTYLEDGMSTITKRKEEECIADIFEKYYEYVNLCINKLLWLEDY